MADTVESVKRALEQYPDESSVWLDGWLTGYSETNAEWRKRLTLFLFCFSIGVMLAYLVHEPGWYHE